MNKKKKVLLLYMEEFIFSEDFGMLEWVILESYKNVLEMNVFEII